ncbi:MAG TPA: diguanylate cyclase [Spirochaetota bacterium]|nr:diguanylate cyclase [Spirochaetota bacterium]HNT09441.1 diguanylate cyclase [Spirochaetota bacterium]
MSELFEKNSRNIWKPFILNIMLVILLFIVGIFIGIFFKNKDLIESGMLSNARAHFRNIVITRSWNARYGGVYVEKTKGVESNPYLKNPDIHGINGKTYTKKNPALMTREISQIAERDGLFRFHITSLMPLNPGNKADPFEEKALRSFERGTKETSTVVRSADRYLFRYMAPLIVEQSCLPCHADQGYRIGDIRGGISVSFDITDTRRQINLYMVVIIILGVATFAIIFLIIYLLIRKLIRRIAEAQVLIEEMATHDELTGLYNRRYFFTRYREECDRAIRYRKNLCIMMIDIDHFKAINDTHGHQIGDVALKNLSELLMRNTRASDIAARYGGEEFVVMIPEAGRDGVMLFAEKIRSLVESSSTMSETGADIRFTISIGIVIVGASELAGIANTDTVIKFADDALYRAKRNGRNRIEIDERP